MYPKVDSTFSFSVTHEIVGKLVKSLEQVVIEINQLAEADPDDPHHFKATMTSIRLDNFDQKPYILESVTYEVWCVLYIKNEDRLIEFSERVEIFYEPVGPIDSSEVNLLHLKDYVVTLEEIYCGISRFARHLYADEARKYIWRDGVKKLE